MDIQTTSLALLGAILFFGLLLPQWLRVFHFPFVTSLVVAGGLLGPHGFALVELDDTLRLFAGLGAVFYMLLAGYEAEALQGTVFTKTTGALALTGGLFPAVTGAALGRLLGFDWPAALLLATVFISTSSLLNFSFASRAKRVSRSLAEQLQASAVVYEVTAAVLAFVLFKVYEPHPRFSTPILVGLFLCSIVVLRFFLPQLVAVFFAELPEKDRYEGRLRLIIALLLMLLFFYASFEVPAIIGAFIVGFVLSGVPDAGGTKEKLRTVGYGVFIPVFLFVLGADTDFRALLLWEHGRVTLLIIIAVFVTKIGGGLVGARWVKRSYKDGWTLGVASSAKLALPITAAYTAQTTLKISTDVTTAIVTTAIVSTVLVPSVLRWLTRQPKKGDD